MQCRGCKQTLSSEEIQFEQMPNNLCIDGIETGEKLPKCPHCGDIAFFGFIDIEGENNENFSKIKLCI